MQNTSLQHFGLGLAFLVQFIAVVWWGAKLDSKVEQHDSLLATQAQINKTQTDMTIRIERSIAKINWKLGIEDGAYP